MLGIIENTDTQKRQYIDAESVFEELRRVRKEVTQTRGGMIWREINGRTYLVWLGARSFTEPNGAPASAAGRLSSSSTGSARCCPCCGSQHVECSSPKEPHRARTSFQPSAHASAPGRCRPCPSALLSIHRSPGDESMYAPARSG